LSLLDQLNPLIYYIGFNLVVGGDYKSLEKYFKSIRVKRVSIISFKGYGCKD
jgi:hypothetical protein